MPEPSTPSQSDDGTGTSSVVVAPTGGSVSTAMYLEQAKKITKMQVKYDKSIETLESNVDSIQGTMFFHDFIIAGVTILAMVSIIMALYFRSETKKLK